MYLHPTLILTFALFEDWSWRWYIKKTLKQIRVLINYIKCLKDFFVVRLSQRAFIFLENEMYEKFSNKIQFCETF
jgi:hypothetical protein